MRGRRRLVVPALAGAMLLAGPLPAGSADQDQVDRAQARVGQVRDEVASLRSEVERSVEVLTEGTRRYEQGRARLRATRAEAGKARRAADAAQARTRAARRQLGEVVSAAYRRPLPGGVAHTLAAEPGQVAEAVLAAADLDHVRGSQQELLREAVDRGAQAEDLAEVAAALEARAAAEQARLSRQVRALQRQAGETRDRLQAAAARLQAAEDARLRAEAAERARLAAERARRLAAEKARAEAAVRAARTRAAVAAARTAEQRAAAQRAAAQQAAEQAAAQQATQQAAAQPAPGLAQGDGATSGVSAAGGTGTGCGGGSTAGYPNGFLPVSALCPLRGAPGHRLRADAAAAFNRMAAVRPLCVTDSYRDYAAQVDVYQRKPHLAAIPGTSNHGWGVAVDLCGGVQTFGTEAYRWMKANGPRYGWHHPGWAEPGGSRPEPWHWEYRP